MDEPTGMRASVVENVYGLAVFGGVTAGGVGLSLESWLAAALGVVITALGMLGWSREAYHEQRSAWWRSQLPRPPCMIEGCDEPRMSGGRPFCRQHTGAPFGSDSAE